MIWQLKNLVNLHWRFWGQEWVAFDAGSNETYQIDRLSVVALLILESGPCELHDLGDRVAEDLEITKHPEFSAQVEDALARLRTAGLIETTSQ